MQTSERSTRSSRKFIPEQLASPGPEHTASPGLPGDPGQYMCIECGETFDTRLELNTHRQSHVTQKQFTCAHCGRGFHHQVFLQMHERSHENGGSGVHGGSGVKAPPPPRVISTRSSKVPNVVQVKPTKPPCRLNSTVRFKNEQEAGQTSSPKECVTRRGHGAASACSLNEDGLQKNKLFELRISKFSDSTVHLMDSFGNSIEILADVFNTYTIGEAEEDGGEATTRPCEKSPSTNTSDGICSVEGPSASPQAGLTEPPLAGDMDLHHTPSHVSGDKVLPNHTSLPVLENVSASELKKTEGLPTSETIGPPSDKELSQPPEDAEEHMDTSPGPTSPEGLQMEAEASPEGTLVTSTANGPPDRTDSQEEDPSTIALPVALARNEDQSLLDDPASKRESACRVPETNADQKQPEESAEQMIEDIDQPEAEVGLSLIPPVASRPETPELPSAHSVTLERTDNKQASKEEADLCNALPIDKPDVSSPPETTSMDRRSEEEPGGPHEEATWTPASSEGHPESTGADKHGLQPPSTQDNLQLETDMCMTSQGVGEASTAQGEASTAQGEASTTQGEASTAQGEASTAQGEASTAQGEASTTQGEASTAQGEASTAQGEASTSQGEASTSQGEASTTQGEASTSQGEASTSPERQLQVDSKEAEKACGLLAEQDILQDDELVIDDKREDDLFERDIFPLEAPMEACEKGLASVVEDQSIVCRGEGHHTKMVQRKESDICLNSSDMTYISESEMIRLLEQDKDDMADEEAIMAEPQLEPPITRGHGELPAALEHNISEVQHLRDLPTFQTPPEEKMEAESCLPLHFLTNDEPRTGDLEPQIPTENVITQNSVTKDSAEEQLGFTQTSSSSNFRWVTKEGNRDVPPPERGLLGEDQKYESYPSSSEHVGESALSTIEDITPQEDTEVFVTVEDNECDDKGQQTDPLESPPLKEVEKGLGLEKPEATTPDYKVLVSVAVCSIEPEQSMEHLPSSQTDPEPLPGQAMENLPEDVLDYDENGDHTNTSSSRRTNDEGMSNKQTDESATFLHGNQEADTEDLDPKNFPKTLSTSENVGSQVLSANADLGGLEDVTVLKEDMEKRSVPSAKDVIDDKVSEMMEQEGGPSTKPVSDVSSVDQPGCLDGRAPDCLDDPEFIDDETPSKPSGAGECLKCGRKLRRGRKELVWLPVCYKCRKAAKRQERLSNREATDDLDLEALQSREESFSMALSNIKEDGEGLQREFSEEATTMVDPFIGDDEKGALSSTKKRYACPKCDETFRIPALLAGHIKCHTLPQCLTCGCQIPLKYKTKRIPRRCQKCFQQLKEKMRREKEAGEGSGDEGTSDNEDAVSDLNPDEEEEADDDDGLVLGKSPKNPAGKPPHYDEGDSFKEDLDMESFEELNTSDQNVEQPESEKPRLCPQCAKAFPCNRSLNLHLLSHSGIQCETCGCRLPKRRRLGRWSKKCRSCRLQIKDKLLNDSEDEMDISSDKPSNQKNGASLRQKAKPSTVGKNAKIQSMVKKKKELKWMNMLLAVKGLMDKSRRKKENALKAADLAKKDDQSSEAEKCDPSLADHTNPDQPKSDQDYSEKAGPSNKAPKQGRKCLYREKNIIKVEETEVLPYIPTSDGTISTAFIKQEDTWQCLECTHSWPNSEALVNHQHSHMSGQSFTCPQCPQVFSSQQFLEIHAHAHDDNRPFRCTECDKTFTKRNHLGVHMRVHSGSRPFACPDCPCRFRQKVTLIAHRYSHRNYQLLFTKPFQCSVCTKSFKQKERLVVHERLHTGECPFSCKDCDKVFPSKARLYVHRKMHKLCDASSGDPSSQEVSGEQPFKCQDCGKICSTKASFVLHRKVHRLSPIPVQSIKCEENEEVHAFTCRECNKAFSSKYSLKMHRKNHSAHKATAKSEMSLDLKGAFPCKVCAKVCSTKASLVLHRRVHKSLSVEEQNLIIKEEPDTPHYICKICNKMCSTKASLVLHRRAHKTPTGTDTGPPPFICMDCDMVCSTKASFVLHRKVHRPSSSNQQSPKTNAEPQLYNCKHCDMVCSTKASFVLHSKVHRSLSIGEQNLKSDAEPQSYNCKHCDMVCSTKASFALHSKVHRALINEQSPKVMEEPQLYNCKYCDMVCSTKASFVLHSKVHRSLFDDEQSLKIPEEPQSYNCKHCDMVCSTKAGFVLHNKVHRLSSGNDQSPKAAEELKSYSCKECDMVCSTKASFVLHSRVHKSGQNLQGDPEESSFTCKDCNKVCSTKASFILHRRVHKASSSEHNLDPKGDGEEPSFQCKECDKIFSSKGRLSAHGKVHEDQNSDSESNAGQPKKTGEEKPYPCTICGLRFVKLKMLVRHKAVHGERTITPCIHCGKEFLYMKSLFNHIKICQSKGKKGLKKGAAKRKLLKDGGSTSSDGEGAQKKQKIAGKPKVLTAAQKLKHKTLMAKAKKSAAGKEKGKGKAAGLTKTKDKRGNGEEDGGPEGEGKKMVTEKQSDTKPEKSSDQAPKEPTPKKKLKKEPAKDKPQKAASGGPKKWRVLASSTAKKKNLQAVLIGGKKKLLMKKKVQLKPKSGGKVGKD